MTLQNEEKKQRHTVYMREWLKNPENARKQKEAKIRFLTHHSSYRKDYRAKNKDREKELRQKWLITHSETLKQQIKMWREANPDKVLAHRHTYYKVHPDARAEQTKKYRANYPEKIKSHEKSRYSPLDLKCNSCGATSDLQRHHPDYTKPKIFITLCRKCHGKFSRRKRS